MAVQCVLTAVFQHLHPRRLNYVQAAPTAAVINPHMYGTYGRQRPVYTLLLDIPDRPTAAVLALLLLLLHKRVSLITLSRCIILLLLTITPDAICHF